MNALRRVAHLLVSPVATGVYALVLVGFGAFHLDRLEDTVFRSQRRAHVLFQVGAVRSSIEESVNLYLRPLVAAEALVITDPSPSAEVFAQVGRILSRDLPALLELQLAPGGVIAHVHPPQRAEAVMGLDVTQIPGQGELVRQTIADGQLRLVGPIDLIQGGRGLIARRPIYYTGGPATSGALPPP